MGKRLVLLLLCACAARLGLGQKARKGAARQVTRSAYLFDGNGNMVGGTHIRTVPGQQVTLRDEASGTRYVLDAAHIVVTAISAKGDTLWRTDPWKDNHLEAYRTSRPVIVGFAFDAAVDKAPDLPREALSISYNNTQFGRVYTATGKFDWLGQD